MEVSTIGLDLAKNVFSGVRRGRIGQDPHPQGDPPLSGSAVFCEAATGWCWSALRTPSPSGSVAPRSRGISSI
jgi:hypothetical protein